MRLMRQRMFLLVKGGQPLAQLAEVIAAAKAKPQAVSHGSSGIGSIYHSVFVVLEKRAGVEFLHVPYTGGGAGAAGASPPGRWT